MRKFIGGVLRFLLLAALTAAVAWNTFQVQELQARIARLEAGGAPQAPAAPGAAPTNPLEAIRESKRHADRAQRLIQEGRLDLARREIAQAGQRLRDAGQQGLAGAPDLSALTDLRRRVEGLARQAEELVRSPDAAPTPPPRTQPAGKDTRK